MASSSNTPTGSQPINKSKTTPEIHSANASPSTRAIGIASPPIPNIPPRNTDSPFGTSFKPRSFASSVHDKGEFGPSSFARRKGLSDGPGSGSGNNGQNSTNKDKPTTSKDLGLGEKRQPGASTANTAQQQVSALSARLGGGEHDKKDDKDGETRGRSSKSTRVESKSKSPARSDEDEQRDDKSNTTTTTTGDKKRPDLELPAFPRQISATSIQNQLNNHTNKKDTHVTTPGESGISSHVVTPTQIEEIPEEEKLRILRRHLVSAEERQAGEARRGSVVDHETPRTSIMQSQTGGADPHGTAGSTTSRKSSDHHRSGGSLLPEFRNASGLNVPNDTVLLNDDEPGAGASGVSRVQPGTGRSSRKGSMRLQEEESQDVFPMPYDALGGDVTHGIYKYQQTHGGIPSNRRSLSLSAVQRNSSLTRDLDPSLQRLHEPGGMRRHYVIHRAVERGEDQPVVLRSFVDFLFLYGHFAGEDLDEDDDDVDLDEEANTEGPASSGLRQRQLNRQEAEALGERAPLLRDQTRGKSVARLKRGKSVGKTGDATVFQAVLMLLKGFVGTGVLFLGKAFFNGGILFSTIVMLGIAAISLWSFLLLVKTRLVIPGSFGDMGGTLYGNWFRQVILTSIALSQIGFVCAYTIFVAENLQAFVLGVTKCKKFIPIKYLIAAQLVVVLPLSLFRNLAALSSTALIADAFILVGLIYIGSNEVTTIVKHGVADVQLFNAKDFSLMVGTAVFAFEGIGLLIPITEAMKEPHKFPKVLTGVMIGVAALFAGFGVMGYAAYGSNIQTVVIVNLPQEDKFVQVVQFLYTIAIVLSLPLQLFPAVRIWENGIFVRSGKHDPKVKWEKNIFRAGIVLLCSLISWAGASNLDGFVSFIGSFACVPLCFIYPPMLHLKGRARTRTQKALDIGLLAFGIITTIYTTVQTIRVLARPAGEAPPKMGGCQPPK